MGVREKIEWVGRSMTERGWRCNKVEVTGADSMGALAEPPEVAGRGRVVL